MAIDYTTMSGSGPQSDTAPAERQWWKQSGDEAARSISAVLKTIQQYQSRRMAQHLISARLYGNLSTMGLGGVGMAGVLSRTPSLRDRITYNIIQSVVDTITSKIAKNRPRPLFLTSGGDYIIQRKAKGMNQFMDGVFYENKAHQLATEIFRDACVFGDGFIHVYHSEGRVKYARVLSGELFVDELEGFYGSVRQMHRVRAVDRGQLIEAYPGHKQVIQEAKEASAYDAKGMPSVSDLVQVRESWHLPSGEDASDGKYAISVDSHLLSEMTSWEHDFFPFARFTWSKRLLGYWGQSLSEQIQNIQLEVNKILFLIQRSYHLGASFKLLIERGSRIIKEHLTNDVGATIEYSGTAPQYVVPPLLSPEIYTHLQTLVQRAYEQSGISMLSAVSQKPAGLNSGKALREFNDIESDRFQTTGKDFEQLHLDLAKLSIATISDAEIKGYKVRATTGRYVKEIKWRDVVLPEEAYVMQCFPVSSLPNDPAGRLQTIQEYAQAGYLTQRQARRLLDFPDLEQVESLQNAEEDYLNEVLEKIIDEGVMTPPEPFDDLTLAREMALEWYARGRTQKLPEERLDLLRRYMQQIDDLQAMAAQPPPGAELAAPQAAPMAPPTSDLIPNAPGILNAA